MPAAPLGIMKILVSLPPAWPACARIALLVRALAFRINCRREPCSLLLVFVMTSELKLKSTPLIAALPTVTGATLWASMLLRLLPPAATVNAGV